MRKYFPFDLDLKDKETPAEILAEAKKDWSEGSEGLLQLDFEDAESKAGNSMIIVRMIHTESKASAKLFSVVHRPGMPYPVRINLEDDLPQFLKKTYYEPGTERIHNPMGSIRSMLEPQVIRTEGKTIENEWVAETPAEFRSILSSAFEQGYIKALVVNLANPRPPE